MDFKQLKHTKALGYYFEWYFDYNTEPVYVMYLMGQKYIKIL